MILKKLLSGTVNGILGGICIALGGGVFLACDNKYVGAALFCVALLTICWLGFGLYTGKIGTIVEKHDKDNVIVIITALVGNYISTLLFGLMLSPVFAAMKEKAAEICAAKLEQPWYGTLIRGIMCGILMYIAVTVYAKKKTPLGILFCIPVFILSGFEHSIADMFYFAIGGVFGAKYALFIVLVVLGNSIGGVLLPLLEKARDCCKPN